MEELEKHNDAAAKAAEAAYELKIAEDTRSFLDELEREPIQPALPKRVFLITGMAASILILVISMWTINQSHSDGALASDYGINQVTPRSGENITNSGFTEAVRSYYAEEYEEADRILAGITGQEGGKINDFKDWLSILIELQTAGSGSDTFKRQLDEVISDENHEFHLQAVKLNKDLNHFWRFLVIGK